MSPVLYSVSNLECTVFLATAIGFWLTANSQQPTAIYSKLHFPLVRPCFTKYLCFNL